MKFLTHWGATLSLAGSILLGTLLGTGSSALALTNEQVMERLAPVPVFILVDSNSAPIVAEQESGTVTPVFISHESAETFLANALETDPSLAEQQVRVMVLSLAQVYELAVAEEEGLPPFRFVPVRQEVEEALAILQQDGETVQDFPGVPLFAAKLVNEEGESYLAMQQGDVSYVPVYFSEDQLQAELEQWRQANPDQVNNLEIEVGSLGNFIEGLRSSDNPDETNIYLIPLDSSVTFVRNLQQQAQQQQQQQQQQQPQQ